MDRLRMYTDIHEDQDDDQARMADTVIEALSEAGVESEKSAEGNVVAEFDLDESSHAEKRDN